LHLAEMESPKQLAAIIESRLDVGFIRSRTDYPDGVSASVIRQERLLLALPADHRLADEVQALEIEALSGETLILPQFEEDAGFTDYVTEFVAAARPMPDRVYPVRGIPTALSLVGRRGWCRADNGLLALFGDGERRLRRDRRLRAGHHHGFGPSHQGERPSRARLCRGMQRIAGLIAKVGWGEGFRTPALSAPG